MTIHVFEPKHRVFTASDSPELLYWVDSMLLPATTALVIDLSGIAFIDSSGIGALVIAHNRAKRINIKFILCGLSEQVRMSLHLTGLMQVFEAYSTLAECEAALLPA
ncbi:MAG TPA: STAS domain-containing protein [Chroococcidiopsis sp.]